MQEAAWDPPGAGFWRIEAGHCLGAMTPIGQHLMVRGMRPGMTTVFRLYGVPAETLDPRFVNGRLYTRLRPLIAPDKPATKLPPAPLLKLVVRLHPEFRRRNKNAAHTLATQPWRRTVREWDEKGRAAQAAKNYSLQDVDLGALDDAALMAHAARAVEHAIESYQLHFVLHGADLGPIGMLISESATWSLPVDEVIGALAGASPSTSEPTRLLAALRQRIDAAGVQPTTLEEPRAASPEIAADLDAYLRVRGAHVFSRYDIDGVTLGELPDLVLASVMGAEETPRTDDPEGLAASLRARVPVADRARFDELLTEARLAMDLRDDNGPHTVEWTLGLIRLALLEIGRRLVERGRIDNVRLVMELTPDELSTVLTDRGPTNDELSLRAEHRRAMSTLTAPTTLGTPEPEPPPGTLPRPLETLIAVVQCVINLLDKQPARHGLAGTGVGTRSYTGPVRIARSPEEAVNNVEIGDVLVVPFTTPAYNVILSAVGAIVTVDGGPLSHAAVLARELEIPAVIGASEALAQLRDGMIVEVDPTAGEVRVLSAVNQ